METHFKDIISSVEPIADSNYGPRYRCELTLKDGTYLPCAVIQSKNKLIELAKRRIKEETTKKDALDGPDPNEQILSAFVAQGNRINDYEVASAAPSRFAPPLALLGQIEGETTMGWTGWVFEMMDGRLFSYGSSFSMEFFHLPDGYIFSDVAKVHNHSFLSKDGMLVSLRQRGMHRAEYNVDNLFRERVYFTCYIDGI